MRYALIDWDNTIHRGYTIYGLTDYLVSEGLVAEELPAEFEELKLAYRAGRIDYADYTIRTCEAFARALAGRSLEAYRSCVAAFVPCNENFLFPEAYPLFELLRRLDIEVYLVSGAPAEVLRGYAEKFSLSGIFGFELEEREGTLTGRVACNYGVDKDRALRLSPYRAPNSLHLLSLGDAVADIPLLENARVPVIVGEGRLALRASLSPLRFPGQAWDLKELERRLAAELASRPKSL